MATNADASATVPTSNARSREATETRLRCVTSSPQHAVEHLDTPSTVDVRRVNSLAALPVFLDKEKTLVDGLETKKDSSGQALTVRFVIDAKEAETVITDRQESTHLQYVVSSDDDADKNNTRSKLANLRDLLRSSFKRKSKREETEKHDTDVEEDVDYGSSQSGHLQRGVPGDDLSEITTNSRCISTEYIENSERDSVDDQYLWAKFCFKHHPFHFQRSQSTKSRLKPLAEEDDVEVHDIAHSVTDGNFLYRSSSFMLRHLQLRAACDNVFYCQRYHMVCSHRVRQRGFSCPPDELSHQSASDNYDHNKWATAHVSTGHYGQQNVKERISDFLASFHGRSLRQSSAHSLTPTDRRKRSPHRLSTTEGSFRRRLIGHSLASVELGSWASRGSRRGSALPPFFASLSPTEASSRSEILQGSVKSRFAADIPSVPMKIGVVQAVVLCVASSACHSLLRGLRRLSNSVSSAIIHLFQRKPLKDNELGLLQEHVRFLINSEAGGLVHEYYKDQLLRKGMIILREKIKNEQGGRFQTMEEIKECLSTLSQKTSYRTHSTMGKFVGSGLELLKQLSETWEYFFKEILPTLQAILYPLTGLLTKDETIRSLTLLAFRNIVVLKVSIKEALDSVEKHSYPPSVQQMFLVLQSIQDNVFLSENEFLLEKLVARVVCPYLGQRGVYEGSPDPVIKVKLKPIPIMIPTLVLPDNRFPGKSRPKLEHQSSYSPMLSPWKAGQLESGGMKKLKPVLEHVYDVGRRHSIIS